MIRKYSRLTHEYLGTPTHGCRVPLGDTSEQYSVVVPLKLDLGLGCSIQKDCRIGHISVRPDKEQALRERLDSLLNSSQELVFRTEGQHDRYGAVAGQLLTYPGGQDLGETLIHEGLAHWTTFE